MNINKYRNLGIKLTPQRLAVLDYLEGKKSHPSAEDIYQAVKKQFPTISIATVYNILETLKQNELIQELRTGPYKKRFDPNTSWHHHLLCTGCNRVEDVAIKKIPEIAAGEGQGFEISKVHVEFYGLCQKCRLKKIRR